ncbi:hypothetical protein B9Q02_09925, partial [Candidatus Marsarchaeota G1 archaeon BE_D]
MRYSPLNCFSGVLSYALIGSIILGVLVVVLIERVTDYFTSYTYNPVKRIAESSQTGPATNFLTGFATGLSSTAPVALILVAAIIMSYLGGYYA